MKYVHLALLFAVATKAIGGLALTVAMRPFWSLPIVRRLTLLPASVALSGALVFVVHLILLEENTGSYLLILITCGYLITGITCLYLTLLLWGVLKGKGEDAN